MMAEMCNEKIKQKLGEFDPKKVFMSRFSEREQTIIEFSSRIKGKHVDLFTPSIGIVK
jgi:hypothetical protein